MIPDIRLVRTEACPRCAAGAHLVCRRKDGSPRAEPHKKRVERYLKKCPWNRQGES